MLLGSPKCYVGAMLAALRLSSNIALPRIGTKYQGNAMLLVTSALECSIMGFSNVAVTVGGMGAAKLSLIEEVLREEDEWTVEHVQL